MNLKSLFERTFLATSLSALFIIVFYFVSERNTLFPLQDSQLYLTFILIVFGTTLTVSLFYSLRDFSDNPTTYSIALLGRPGSGKTVFLTVLFNELATNQNDDILFTPYGVATVEKVTNDLNNLILGQWPMPTTPGSLFVYRANAKVGSGLYSRKYKLEIGDFAGENLTKTLEKNNDWLHRSEYFKYVVQSDAVILALDAHQMLENTNSIGDVSENELIAALQVLFEAKEMDFTEKSNLPIALTFTKGVLISENERNLVEEKANRLIGFCEARFKSFAVFWMSSIGELGPEGQPPENLQPYGVIEPIIWFLSGKTQS